MLAPRNAPWPGFAPAPVMAGHVQPLVTNSMNDKAFAVCGITQSAVILSEAKNLSWFLFIYLNRREILRFAQNDKTIQFFRSLLEDKNRNPA